MCCNIHYLSAEQTPRQGGWMCCNVNHLNAKQTPSIISCSDVLIVFYFRTHFFDCLYDRARARRRLVPYVPGTRGAVRSDEERSPLLIRDSDSSAAQGRSGFGGCWLPWLLVGFPPRHRSRARGMVNSTEIRRARPGCWPRRPGPRGGKVHALFSFTPRAGNWHCRVHGWLPFRWRPRLVFAVI